jgi:hypothetical protein
MEAADFSDILGTPIELQNYVTQNNLNYDQKKILNKFCFIANIYL